MLHKAPKCKPLTESEVVDITTLFLKRQGYRVRHEVPNMGQSADIVATRAGAVMCVEAKMSHWRRALEQCRAHEQVADYVSIALGMERVPKTLIAALESLGYGLILCQPSKRRCRWIKRADKNGKVWGPQRRRLVSALRGINYAN